MGALDYDRIPSWISGMAADLLRRQDRLPTYLQLE